MPVNPVNRLLVFFTVYYLSQGFYNSFGTFEQPYLRSKKLSLTDISGARSVAIIPWSIKLLMAIPCDMLGRRLPFVFVGMIFGASLLMSLTSFDPGTNFGGYMATVFFRNVGIAFSDVAVDGMSVDCGLDHMAGTVQGFMSLGRVTGTLLGSAIGGPIAKESYNSLVIFLGVIILTLVPVVFLVKEEKNGKSDAFEWAAFRELKKPSVVAFLLYAMLGNLSGSLGGVPSTEWAQARVGMSVEDLGYLSVVGSIGDLVGAVGTGFLFDRVDKRLGMFFVAAVGAALTPVAISVTTIPSWYALGFFSGILSGALFVVNCGMVMRLADKRLGASVFAIAVSLMNFSSMIGNAISGPAAEAYGLEAAFWISFAVNLLQLVPVAFIQEVGGGGGGDGKGVMGSASPSGSPGGSPSKGGLSGGGADDDGDVTVVKNILHAGASSSSSLPSSSPVPFERHGAGVLTTTNPLGHAGAALPGLVMLSMSEQPHHQHGAGGHRHSSVAAHLHETTTVTAVPGDGRVSPAALVASSAHIADFGASAYASAVPSKVAAPAHTAVFSNPFGSAAGPAPPAATPRAIGAPLGAGNPFARASAPPVEQASASAPAAAAAAGNPFGPGPPLPDAPAQAAQRATRIAAAMRAGGSGGDGTEGQHGEGEGDPT
jgi:predicted MFS family arabinose efflux permease